MRNVLTALSVLLASTPLLSADALKPEFVAARARFLVHVDVRAALKSRLFEDLLRQHIDLGGEDWEELETRFGIDPRRDVSSVTVYGTSADSDGAVVLVQTNDRVDGALLRVQQESEYRSTQRGGYVLHTHSGGGEDAVHAYLHPFGRERIVVISSSPDRVVNAVRVLEGQEDSLAKSGAAHLRARPEPGCLLFAAGDTALSEIQDLEPVSRIARLARSFELQLGEGQDNLFVRLRLEAENSDLAASMQQVLQGAMALLSLVGDDDGDAELREAKRLLNSLQFYTRGNVLTVELEHELDDLLRLVGSDKKPRRKV